METGFEGRTWRFGDGVSTDQIISGRHLATLDVGELARVVFEDHSPGFSDRVKEGDIIVAGRNFGCGSSREAAPAAIKACGVRAVIAESFGRIFYRNAVNLGLLVVECPGISRHVEDGDRINVDIERGEVVLPSGKALALEPLPANIREILESGGLVNKVREELRSDTE